MTTELDELNEYRRRLLERMEAVGAAVLAHAGERAAASPGEAAAWLGHLAALQDGLFLPVFRQFLAGEQALEGDTTPPAEPPAAADFPRLRGQFARDWVEMQALLRPLPARAWSRSGRHPRAGVRTLQWWLERCLAHAARHVDQG
jgi:hypothetical protein